MSIAAIDGLDDARGMSTALVLAGAVAKGAFEAGVLAVLAERDVRPSAIVATSAGSLNAALFATGLRFGRARQATDSLLKLWREEATWTSIVRPTLRGLVDHTGVSSTDALERIVLGGMNHIAQEPLQSAPRPINLKLVTASLNGDTVVEQGIARTTFEHVENFEDRDFESEHGRQRVAHAALASAAFPVLFVPVQLPNVGPCIDGGAVNNTPISWALDSGADHVVVVAGNPLRIPREAELGGAELLGKEVDIAINERLFRDLWQARRVNQKLEALQAAMQQLSLSTEQRTKLLGVLDWKPLKITEIRPSEPLPGNAFSALGDAELRNEYIQLGRAAAESAL